MLHKLPPETLMSFGHDETHVAGIYANAPADDNGHARVPAGDGGALVLPEPQAGKKASKRKR